MPLSNKQALLLKFKYISEFDGLKTYNLSEATNFNIRAFHLPTSCDMMQFKGMKIAKLEINWPKTGN